MQIKSKILLYFFIIFFSSNLILKADEFNISAKEITFDKDNNVLIGKGEVEVTDNEGKVIKSDKVIYEKENEFLTIEGNVEFFDTLGNILKTNKAIYDKKAEIVNSYENWSVHKILKYEISKLMTINQCCSGQEVLTIIAAKPHYVLR